MPLPLLERHVSKIIPKISDRFPFIQNMTAKIGRSARKAGAGEEPAHGCGWFVALRVAREAKCAKSELQYRADTWK